MKPMTWHQKNLIPAFFCAAVLLCIWNVANSQGIYGYSSSANTNIYIPFYKIQDGKPEQVSIKRFKFYDDSAGLKKYGETPPEHKTKEIYSLKQRGKEVFAAVVPWKSVNVADLKGSVINLQDRTITGSEKIQISDETKNTYFSSNRGLITGVTFAFSITDSAGKKFSILVVKRNPTLVFVLDDTSVVACKVQNDDGTDTNPPESCEKYLNDPAASFAIAYEY